jgi:hypothetical protein
LGFVEKHVEVDWEGFEPRTEKRIHSQNFLFFQSLLSKPKPRIDAMELGMGIEPSSAS